MKTVIYWNTATYTTAIITHNRPDVMVIDKLQKEVPFGEVSVVEFSRLKEQRLIKINRYEINSND